MVEPFTRVQGRLMLITLALAIQLETNICLDSFSSLRVVYILSNCLCDFRLFRVKGEPHCSLLTLRLANQSLI